MLFMFSSGKNIFMKKNIFTEAPRVTKIWGAELSKCDPEDSMVADFKESLMRAKLSSVVSENEIHILKEK